MDQPTAETMLRALGRFVGEWTMAAGPPGGPPWSGAARVWFEWLPGEVFLRQRWTVDHPDAPDGTAIIGCDAANGAYTQLYADERGVCRVYEMRLDGDVWTLRRTGAPFAQRFTGTFSAGDAAITGRWELAREGADWATDFEVVYTRVV
jgi:hypothetical protein